MPSPEPDHTDVKYVTIGGRVIGPAEQPSLVVAEIGVNHDGSAQRARQLVDAAAAAGADAVKFQVFITDELVASDAPAARYQQHHCRIERQAELLASLELSEADLHSIRAHCHELGVIFIATPFGNRALEMTMQLDPAAIKLSSTDLVHRRLVDAAADSGRPVILSLGASTHAEISAELRRILGRVPAPDVVALHCVSCYPTPLTAINLCAIRTLRRDWSFPIGLSDHTVSMRTGGLAVACGARLLEKHFTLDSSADGPDHASSLEPEGFREYVAFIREAETALGTGVVGMTPIEDDVRTAARRSVVAACEIPAGTEISPTMLTLKRPGSGLAPDAQEELIGRKAQVSIAKDALLSWEMVS